MNSAVTDLTNSVIETTSSQGVSTPISLPEDQFLHVVDKLIANTTTPTKLIVERLVKLYSELKKSTEVTDSSKKEMDCEEKLLQVYERYNLLETLYKEEHTHVLNLSDDKLQLQTKLEQHQRKLKEYEQTIRTLEARLPSSQAKVAWLESNLTKEKEDHKIIESRQAKTRMMLENSLLAKNKQLDLLQKNLNDLEKQNNQLKQHCDLYTDVFNAMVQQQPHLQQYLQLPHHGQS